jgi:hypothetical protein
VQQRPNETVRLDVVFQPATALQNILIVRVVVAFTQYSGIAETISTGEGGIAVPLCVGIPSSALHKFGLEVHFATGGTTDALQLRQLQVVLRLCGLSSVKCDLMEGRL